MTMAAAVDVTDSIANKLADAQLSVDVPATETPAEAKVSTPRKTTLLFSVSDSPGVLERVLTALRGSSPNLSLTRIESRPSLSTDFDYDFFVDFDAANPGITAAAVKSIEPLVNQVRVVAERDPVPWFPRKIADLDSFAAKTLSYGEELAADHPGFTDPVYRARREEITRIARTYRHGQPIPRIEYTDSERATWRAVYNNLTQLYPTHACREHRYIFPLLEQNCGYGPDNIPQLEDISRFLRDCTGFTLRPVTGLLSARDFLNGLAFRVFHSTQYVRHHSVPLYTPEPDLCHELLGHVPLFADPDFADMSQEFGLASLGASDEMIELLATVYWFTVEFGLCKQNGEIRAYGAGLLSSFGELEHSVKAFDSHRPFDPAVAARTKYPITEYQPIYFVTDSFADAKERIRRFAAESSRPFSVRYNPLTQSVEILDGNERLARLAASIRADMNLLTVALERNSNNASASS
ncbi:phenylalanine-4-hydroxylase [Fonticula alba]|uniref:phenylalanine 4-monooxygenase n=1 Tax=Fonticula alba TaxID=691883 RepID=A0A058ZCQ1_FONAL|nr:phenylalanine-4-hydroxylase [Fonticula alba]KCV71716.1 phenylalanine-4-hydroxylase [Fonticula alba]|eukprot:XP_009493294.1 phenylalanine-4-hydroxylase [Fonticula alba]